MLRGEIERASVLQTSQHGLKPLGRESVDTLVMTNRRASANSRHESNFDQTVSKKEDLGKDRGSNYSRTHNISQAVQQSSRQQASGLTPSGSSATIGNTSVKQLNQIYQTKLFPPNVGGKQQDGQPQQPNVKM